MRSFQLSKQFLKRDLTLLMSAVSLLFMAGTLHKKTQKPPIIVEKQDSAININKDLLLILSLGNKRLLSDLLWIQTLLESDEEHYKKKDLNSWMFLRFLNISILDPLFYENYLYGGLYLSIAKDDVNGAAVIFERGLTHYPDDFKLNLYAGFNYYFEQGDYAKGLKYLQRIENNPQTPSTMKLIINKLRFETTGNHRLALDFLKFEYNNSKDQKLKNKLGADIYALQAEIDLECLNKNESSCNRVDFDGNAYIFNEGKWRAKKEYLPYRIYRPEEKNNKGTQL